MNRTTVAFGKFLSHRHRTRRCLNAHPCDGVSIVPTLRVQHQDFGDRKLYWEFFERGFQQAGDTGRLSAFPEKGLLRCTTSLMIRVNAKMSLRITRK